MGRCRQNAQTSGLESSIFKIFVSVDWHKDLIDLNRKNDDEDNSEARIGRLGVRATLSGEMRQSGTPSMISCMPQRATSPTSGISVEDHQTVLSQLGYQASSQRVCPASRIPLKESSDA